MTEPQVPMAPVEPPPVVEDPPDAPDETADPWGLTPGEPVPSELED